MASAIVAKVYVGVIDDDDSLCRALARRLRAAGMPPIAYASAEENLADVKQPRFGSLVLDVQLPGMSGIELRNQLAFKGVTTPVIFVTAHDDPNSRAAALAGVRRDPRRTGVMQRKHNQSPAHQT